VRRGISIAAAALSLALVAPAIQPAGPISTGVVAQAETALPTLFNPGVKTPKQVSSQGTEYYISDAEKAGAYESVDGYAYIDVTGWPSGLDAYDVPLEGKVVFAQWKDYAPAKDGNGRISPVYASTVKPDGSWAIKFPVWTDEMGQEHNWEATAGQYLRVWIEDYDTEKYQLGFAEYLGQWTGAAQRQKAAWGGLALRNAGPYNIGLQERPQSWLTQPEDQWVKSTDIQTYGNTSGRIFRENQIGAATSGGVTTFKGTDVALPNEKIVGSYLRDELKTQLDEWKAANKGFKYDELVAEQKRAIKAWDADPANAGKPAIAETVWTTSDKDGKYKLQFKGIFNDTHELAKSPSDGVFIAGSDGAIKGKKHVNTDYMYVYPALTVSDGSTSTSENGANMRTMGGAYFSDIASPGALATIGVAGRSNPINVLFAVNNGFPKFDILEYNTTDKPARAGTTVTAKTTSFKSEMPYRIEWYVGDKMVDKVQGTTDRYGNLQDHTFTVPEGTPDNTIVSARIYRTTEKEGSANFDAVDEFRVASQPEVIEDPVEGIEGKPITPVEVVKDIPEGGSVDAPKLPAGLSIDETGKLNGTPEKLTDWGKDEESREIQVPVSIKDKDGKEVATGTVPVTILRDTDGDGIPDTKDDDDDNDGFTDEQEKKAGTDPKDANDKPAEAPAPTITDSPVKGTEGQPITPVEVVKNAPKDGSIEAKDLPKGLTIGKDGKVTGTPEKLTDWGKDEESRDIPVEVTVKDKDGNPVATKTVTVTIERDTDGDGTPDVTDTDDDGDGYTDEQEKKAGTDPKDANDKPAEAPAPTVSKTPVKAVEGQKLAPVEVVKDAPKDGSIEAKGLPKGLTIGKDGKLSGTPDKITDWKKGEEERTVPVEVVVKDKDGKEIAKGTVNVTIQRDTDGDGIPDVTDTDDDGDGYTDEQEKKAGTDPKDANDKPAQDTTGVQPGANDSVPADGKEKPITGKVTGPTEGVTGTLVDKDGKAVPGAKVTIDKDGTVKVTVPEGTKPGSYNVEVKKGDKKIGDLPITITKPGTSEGSIPGLTEDQANKCVGASAASAIPLLLLTPIALGLAMDNQQVKDLTAGFGKQLEDINTGIQKTLGIYNPELAQQFKVQVAPHLQNLALAAGFVASIALLAGVAADQCVPGGGSSDNTSSQK
ncbi:hypothetical protein M3G05_12730, partial [Corynebacterium glucuronolyticum]|nr:hypothetical protein [Corynebacterium glucuronolyticum]